MLSFIQFYYSLSARVLTIPDNLEPPDCKDEITFLVIENNVTISAIISSLDLRSDNVSRYSSPI